MKLTFITDEATQDTSTFIDLAREFQIDSVELRTVANKHVSNFNESERIELHSRLQDANLKICCIGSSVFKCDLDVDLNNEMNKLRKSLEIAQYLGAPLVRIFTFWRKEDREKYLDKVKTALLLALEVARPTGIGLAIENGKRTMHSTGAELEALVRELDTSVFSILWDPGNSIYGGTDLQPVTNGYPCIAAFVSHVHIKDPLVYSTGKRQYVELGKGQLELAAQIEALRKNRFKGYISLETHWRPQHVMSEVELDYPGGEKFSNSGYTATRSSLARLRDLLPLN